MSNDLDQDQDICNMYTFIPLQVKDSKKILLKYND